MRTMTEVEKELQEASSVYDGLKTKADASLFSDGGGAIALNFLLSLAVFVVCLFIFSDRQEYYDYSNDYIVKAVMLTFVFFEILAQAHVVSLVLVYMLCDQSAKNWSNAC